MWEQIFEAFEEQPADLVRSTMDAHKIGWDMFSVPRQRLGMNDRYEDFNPGTQKLDLHFACASPPASASLIDRDLPGGW